MKVTRKADRAKMAQIVIDLAVKHGFTAMIDPDMTRDREIYLTIHTLRGAYLPVSIDASSSTRLQDVWVCCWNVDTMSDAHYSREFERIGPREWHHGRKAQFVVYSWAELLERIEIDFVMIKDGSAFDAAAEAAHVARYGTAKDRWRRRNESEGVQGLDKARSIPEAA